METLEAIRTRRSIRRFSARPVEDEKLNAVLESVRMAPSWANQQCWRFVVVKNAETRRKISDLSYVESLFEPIGYKANPSKKALAEAPVVIAACADPSLSGVLWDQRYYMTDLGIAAQTLMLAARDLGLGTVFVGILDEDKLRSLLGVPSHIRIVGLFPLGYPLDNDHTVLNAQRKPLSEIVFPERYEKG